MAHCWLLAVFSWQIHTAFCSAVPEKPTTSPAAPASSLTLPISRHEAHLAVAGLILLGGDATLPWSGGMVAFVDAVDGVVLGTARLWIKHALQKWGRPPRRPSSSCRLRRKSRWKDRPPFAGCWLRAPRPRP